MQVSGRHRLLSSAIFFFSSDLSRHLGSLQWSSMVPCHRLLSSAIFFFSSDLSRHLGSLQWSSMVPCHRLLSSAIFFFSSDLSRHLRSLQWSSMVPCHRLLSSAIFFFSSDLSCHLGRCTGHRWFFSIVFCLRRFQFHHCLCPQHPSTLPLVFLIVRVVSCLLSDCRYVQVVVLTSNMPSSAH